MKPNLSLNGIETINKLGERITNLLVYKKQPNNAIEFNNRLWCCCTFQEAVILAKEFVDIKE